MSVLPPRAAILRLVVDLLLTPVFVLSYLFPRSDRIAVFGYSNGSSFTDNSKYQYIHSIRNEPDVRPVWLTRNESVVMELRSNGHEVHRFRSWRGVYLTLRAGFVFVTHSRRDVPWYVTGGADVVRFGHGVPFKKYGRANPGFSDRKGRVKSIGHELTVGNFSYSIATSDEYVPYVAEATGLAEDAVHVTGLPRMDMPELPDEDRYLYCERGLLRTLQTEHADSHIVFYFPTWREGNDGPVPEELDVEALDTMLTKTDSYLLTRPHPNSTEWALDASELERVIELDMDSDFYPVFEHVDLFITDYSSLFHDSVFYETPVVFFAHDLSTFTERRELFFEYESVPGDVVTSPEEFNERLRGILEDLDGYERRYEDELATWRHDTFAYQDARNCERVSHTFGSNGSRPD